MSTGWNSGPARATVLADALAAGAALPTQTAPFILQHNEEFYYTIADASYCEWLALESIEFKKVKFRGRWISPLAGVTAIGKAGAAAYNASRKRQAQRQAEAQWRPITTGTLFITNQRAAIMSTARGWADLWYAQFAMIEPSPLGVVISRANCPPALLQTADAQWLYVLLVYLVTGKVIRPGSPTTS